MVRTLRTSKLKLPTLSVISIAGEEDVVAGADVDRIVLEVSGAGCGMRILCTNDGEQP